MTYGLSCYTANLAAYQEHHSTPGSADLNPVSVWPAVDPAPAGRARRGLAPRPPAGPDGRRHPPHLPRPRRLRRLPRRPRAAGDLGPWDAGTADTLARKLAAIPGVEQAVVDRSLLTSFA
jgi:hypothetical protein